MLRRAPPLKPVRSVVCGVVVSIAFVACSKAQTERDTEPVDSASVVHSDSGPHPVDTGGGHRFDSSDTGETPGPVAVDEDGDGFTDLGGDCNDEDPSIHPGAYDACGDLVDNDCDGVFDRPNCGWYPDCYARCVMDMSPASYWRLGEDESDPVALDVTGVAHGAYAGVSSDRYGQPGALATDSNTAISFADAHGRVEFGDAYDAGDSDWTYALWFRTTEAGMMMGKGMAGAGDGYWALGLLGSEEGRAGYAMSPAGEGSAVVVGSQTLTDGEWHSLFFTLDRDGVGELYVDGVLEATLVESLVPGETMDIDAHLALGRVMTHSADGGSEDGDSYSGWIDEVTVWPRVLSLGAITTLESLARP